MLERSGVSLWETGHSVVTSKLGAKKHYKQQESKLQRRDGEDFLLLYRIGAIAHGLQNGTDRE